MNLAQGLKLAFNEQDCSEYLKYYCKSEQHEMFLEARDTERAIQKLELYREKPCVGQSPPNFYTTKLVSNFVRVVLSDTKRGK